MSVKNVLIIDDDPDVLESIGTILKAEGFNVITADDVNEGYKQFQNAKPDLILCDMMMEQIDSGRKLAEMIRKEDKNIPVYLLSSIGNSTASTVDPSEMGFNGVFQKPVSPADLISNLKKVLSGK